MRPLLIALLSLFVIANPAHARHHYKHHAHHAAHHAQHHHRHAHRAVPGKYLGAEGGKHKLFMCPGCVLRETLAGTVSVSKENADKFVGVINELVKAGYKGPVDCASGSHSHVPGSKHYSGNACDFDQCGWGCVHDPIMKTKTAAAIISKWGLTNGCAFSDCGHVGTDNLGHHYTARHHVRYAHHYHKHYASGV